MMATWRFKVITESSYRGTRRVAYASKISDEPLSRTAVLCQDMPRLRQETVKRTTTATHASVSGLQYAFIRFLSPEIVAYQTETSKAHRRAHSTCGKRFGKIYAADNLHHYGKSVILHLVSALCKDHVSPDDYYG